MFAQRMRDHPTFAEAALWDRLRERQLGYIFRRQAIVCGYIVDFYCGAVRLALEVDGSVHEIEEVSMNDEQKERILENYGIGVLRFTNEDVVNSSRIIVQRILAECEARQKSLKAFLRSSNRSNHTSSSSSSQVQSVQKLPNSELTERPMQKIHRLQFCVNQPDRCKQIPASQCITQPEWSSFLHKVHTFTHRKNRMDHGVPQQTWEEHLFEAKLKLAEYLKKKAESDRTSPMTREAKTS